MIIIRFTILFWVTVKISLHAVMLQKYISFLILFFKASPREYPGLLWLFDSHTPEPDLLFNFQGSFIMNIGINYMNVWHVDVLWCQEVKEFKAGLLTGSFRSCVFCGREKLGVDFGLFNFQDLWHACITLKARKELKKHNKVRRIAKYKVKALSCSMPKQILADL